MSFGLADAFVTVGIGDAGLKAGLAGVKASVSGLMPHLEALSSLSRKVFLGIVGAAGLVVKAAADAEEANHTLGSALQASAEMANENAIAMGQVGKSAEEIQAGVDKATDRLVDFASALQLITTHEDEAIKEGMAFAANLGVSADQMEAVTEVGIGLAEKFFAGDLKAGMEAASKATNGNFRSLEKIVPGLKNATTAAEKLAVVQKYGLAGFEQAKERSNTLTGALKQMWHQVGEVGETFGGVLVPYVKQAARLFEAVSMSISSLSPQQAQSIVKWVAMGAAVAAFIGFAPKILAFGTMVVKVLGFVGSGLLNLGKLFVWLVTSPIGLIVAGVGAIVAVFAYLIGAGDTASGRLIDGFMKIVKFMDAVLGSFGGFTTGFGMLWDQLTSYVAEGLTKLSEWMANGWEHTAEAAEQVWWSSFQYMYKAYAFLKTGAMQFMNWITNAWDKMTDSLGDSMYDAYAAVTDFFSDKTDAQKEDEKQRLAKDRQTIANGKSNEYNEGQKKLDDDYASTVAAAQKKADLERQASKDKRKQNRDANTQQSKDAMAMLESDRKRELASRSAELDKAPKLSDKIKGVYDSLKEKSGLGDITAIMEGVAAQAKKLEDDAAKQKGEAAEKAKNPGDLKFGADATITPAKLKQQGIEQTFKDATGMRALGAKLQNPLQIAKDGVKEQRQTNVKLDKMIDLNTDLLAKMTTGYA